MRSVLMLSPTFHTRALNFTRSSYCRNSRGSVIVPAIADAATVAGEAMNTRELGSPMRPLKLRVVEVMQISAAASTTGRRSDSCARFHQSCDRAALQRVAVNDLGSRRNNEAHARRHTLATYHRGSQFEIILRAVGARAYVSLIDARAFQRSHG